MEAEGVGWVGPFVLLTFGVQVTKGKFTVLRAEGGGALSCDGGSGFEPAQPLVRGSSIFMKTTICSSV